MRRQLLISIAPLVLLAGCATDGGGPRKPGQAEAVGGSSAYGMFLAGQAALDDGRNTEATRFFEQAHAKLGDDPELADRSFTAALLAGDVARAAALTPTGATASEPIKRLGRLVIAVEALAEGKPKIAQDLLRVDSIGFPHRPAAALLAPWAAAAAGDEAASLVQPNVEGDKLVDYFGQVGQAALFERAKRYDEAETDYKAVTRGDSSGDMVILGYGGFLERRGRKADAVALYEKALSADPTSVVLKAARARAAAGKKPPPQVTLRQGAATALLAPAATMISAKQMQIGLGYLRLALRLDPNRDEAWLMVGDVLAANGDAEGARAAYLHPKAGSPEFGAAQAKLAWTYQTGNDKPMALKLARAAAAEGGREARMTLADILRSNDQYAESAELLTGLIAEAKTPDWRLYYTRGMALDRLNRWAEARVDLEMALKLNPDEPELLNYLGYSLIDRGDDVRGGMAMVEKAVAANPRSGAMIDSLGWAHYRLGDYKKAVETLEAAIELEAGDPEINNHLGDAYWKVGRKDEAMFQWRRVLTLDPDAKIKANAEAKVASKLGPDAVAPKVAGP